MALRPILKYPDPRLKQRAEPVKEVTDEIRKLVDDMAETMYAAPGVGLAANQVGVLLRVFVIDIANDDEPSDLKVFINPEITETTGTQTWEEGCLSFPGVTEEIRRAERKLAPLYALHSASVFSPLAKSVWLEQRTQLFRWWLVTAAALRWNGTLKSRDILMAAEAFRGVPGSANLWREMAIHGLPALLQYRREKAANQNQLFQVSGLSLMNDPLFKSL